MEQKADKEINKDSISSELDAMLKRYLIWSLLSFCSFLLVILSALNIKPSGSDFVFSVGIVLLTGLIWVGINVFSQSSLMQIKNVIEEEISPAWLLAGFGTFLIFPFIYFRLKKDIANFKRKMSFKRLIS